MGFVILMDRIKTDYTQYGVTDTKALDDKEQAFHDLMEKMCHEQISYLRSIQEARERENKAKAILEHAKKRIK